MTRYEIRGKEIRFASGMKVTFEYAVWKVAEFPDVIVVCLKVPHKKNYPDNVFAVDYSGRVLWQIRPLVSVTPNTMFTDVSRNGDVVEIYNIDGTLYDIEPHTGKVLRSTFVK